MGEAREDGHTRGAEERVCACGAPGQKQQKLPSPVPVGRAKKPKSIPKPTLLKELLRKRHLTPYRRFCKEYQKVAGQLDRNLAGTFPGERQYMRWVGGELTGYPYPDSCAVLEAMFPGYTIEQLFAPPPESETTAERTEIDPSVISAITHPSSGESGDTIVVPAWTADGEVVSVNISRRLFLQGVGYGSVSIASDSGLELSATASITREFSASISSGDSGPLAQVQTTYNVDRAIASMVDIGTRNRLRRGLLTWITPLSESTRRVFSPRLLVRANLIE